jgi:hypothetical protein
MAPHENPFVFGEIIDDANFANCTDELNQLTVIQPGVTKATNEPRTES